MPFITQGKTNIKYILIVIILATIVGGGIWLLSYRKEGGSPIIPPVEIPKDETADWKTYENKEYGYDFKYPPNFSIYELGPEELSSPAVHSIVLKEFPDESEAPSIWIDIEANPSHLSTEQFFDGDPGADLFGQTKVEDITQAEINNKPALRFVPYITFAGDVIVILPLEDKFLVITDSGTAHQENGIFQAVLDGIKIKSVEKEGFCGSSTYGSCISDSDCITGGCSSQVCQSKNEEGAITTCEFRDCYAAENYGFECKCTDSKCQWTK